MNFAEAINNESKKTFTENGQPALNTTGNSCLDLFGCIGSLRSREDTEVEALFAEAYNEDKLLATKILFYARDIREGCGERKIFRTVLKYLANYHPEALRPNLDLIGVYGRYDDLYSLIDTPVENEMWDAMKKQFEEDIENLKHGNAVSLLAKWIKTPDASSKKTRALGIQTALKLGYSVAKFKRLLRYLRQRIDIVERHMSAGEWDQIKYSEVPSRAMTIYRKAFYKHDSERFAEFTQKAISGEAKINSSTLYPYDLTEKFMHYSRPDHPEVLEAQWKQLPNYVEPGTNAIVMADVSGSMRGRPMASSVGLAIYFAERNIGAYRNLFMTFSANPSIVRLTGETLEQKVKTTMRADWGQNTDLRKAFQMVLDIAIRNNVPQEEMVKSIIVISDMEIDYALNTRGYFIRDLGTKDWLFYDEMKQLYADHGYKIPNIVFWNVDSRNDVFHADAKRKGVQLCSGQSVTTFKQLMGCIGMTPVEMMMKVIDSERYAPITIES